MTLTDTLEHLRQGRPAMPSLADTIAELREALHESDDACCAPYYDLTEQRYGSVWTIARNHDNECPTSGRTLRSNPVTHDWWNGND